MTHRFDVGVDDDRVVIMQVDEALCRLGDLMMRLGDVCH